MALSGRTPAGIITAMSSAGSHGTCATRFQLTYFTYKLYCTRHCIQYPSSDVLLIELLDIAGLPVGGQHGFMQTFKVHLSYFCQTGVLFSYTTATIVLGSIEKKYTLLARYLSCNTFNSLD